MFGIVIFGWLQLLKPKRSGYWFSLLLAIAGVFAFSIHMYFMLTGHPEFTLLGSELLLGMILLVSIAQAVLTVPALTNKNSKSNKTRLV